MYQPILSSQEQWGELRAVEEVRAEDVPELAAPENSTLLYQLLWHLSRKFVQTFPPANNKSGRRGDVRLCLLIDLLIDEKEVYSALVLVQELMRSALIQERVILRENLCEVVGADMAVGGYVQDVLPDLTADLEW